MMKVHPVIVNLPTVPSLTAMVQAAAAASTNLDSTTTATADSNNINNVVQNGTGWSQLQ